MPMSKDEREEMTKLFYAVKKAGSNDWEKLQDDNNSSTFTGLKILARVIHYFDNVDEFLQSLEENELPPIKLKKQELQTLSGGADFSLLDSFCNS
jgi:hypothetical protein